MINIVFSLFSIVLNISNKFSQSKPNIRTIFFPFKREKVSHFQMKHYFTKKTVFKCTRGFIEPIYEIDEEIQTEKIIEKLKKMKSCLNLHLYNILRPIFYYFGYKTFYL